jgi:hypothetical protein
MSKTRKASLTRKNRIEKGLRSWWEGSKPHSKGVIASGARGALNLINIPISRSTALRTSGKTKYEIATSQVGLTDWKSLILSYIKVAN